MNSFQFLAVFISISYLTILFLLAYFVEKKTTWKEYVKSSSSIYALSLAIYCTAWTFYGSIGSASKTGISFLPIYLGPTIMMPFWFLIVKKINRIAKAANITTFADFLSIRYSNSTNLGMFITFLMIVGIIPYISLQIKAISESFYLLMQINHQDLGFISSLNLPVIVTVIMGIFIVIFATQKMESTEHHSGIVASIAFESLFKLLAFLIAGIVICYFIFSSPTEIFQKISSTKEMSRFLTMPTNLSYMEWTGFTILSGIAVMILPRQFQVAVIENTKETHLKSAMWKFPLYLFLINLFVLPVALAGNIYLANFSGLNPDYYLLEIPLINQMKYIGLLVFLGGFSAATAMIAIETVALSNMLSNNFIIPLSLKFGEGSMRDTIAKRTLLLRRISVIIILLLTLIYFKSISPLYSLVSIGLISFVFIAQFFPALLGSLYLKQSNYRAVFGGVFVGFCVWLYTLVLPSIIEGTNWGQEILAQGLFGLAIFKPNALFGLTVFSPVMHSFFWSMFFNVSVYIFLSYSYKPSNYEKQQAHIYVDVFKYSNLDESHIVWKEFAALSDLKSLMMKFMGEEKTNITLNSFMKRFGISNEDEMTSDPRLIPFVERLLSKFVGTVSARILIESVIKEKDIFINEMIDIIQESKEVISLNRELTKKSNELKKAKSELEHINQQLRLHDQTKNEFLSTVSHELKSPLTSIRSLSEILTESEGLSEQEVSNFSSIINKESARITRLINQLLDLEKYDTGKETLVLSVVNLTEFFEDIQDALKAELSEKEIELNIQIDKKLNELIFDRDKLMQVFINLVGNSIKFSQNNTKVEILLSKIGETINMEIKDMGHGIDPLYHDLIFDRFFQAKDQTILKPKGSGLGLAISKKIIELHKGKIYVKTSSEKGTTFAIELPQIKNDER
ncbi:MAG: ATP-binding protein [Chitinophagales bacterium]|jgi:Na+/proline symporter/signal transduction histidine kinase|nr:sensor histidine kinase [Sphingobacteriales bacterium]